MPNDSALLDALFAETAVGLACWDTEFRYQRVNAVLAAMNGLTVEEHLGRSVTEVLPELGPRLAALFAEVLATDKAKRDLHVSGETPAAPGVTRHWLASYFPIRGEEGEAVGIGATVLETTDERNANARARLAERQTDAVDAHLGAVYSALPVGVGFVTPDLRYERVNEALAQMNGLSVEEHLGRTIHEVLGEHGAKVEEITREVIRRQEPTELELAVRTATSPQQERFFEVTYFPVFAAATDRPDGGLLGVGGVVRDVTESHSRGREREQLLRDAVTARAQAEAAHVRAEASRQEAEAALAEAEAQRETAEAANRRAAFLAQVTRRLAASLDYEATLREVVASAVPYIADWGIISVLEPSRQVRVLGFTHASPERARLVAEFAERYRPGPESSVTQAISTGQLVMSTDVTERDLARITADPETLALVRELGVRHFATWPIPSPAGTVIGALSFILGDSGRSFSEGDLQIGQVLADRTGLHLSNALLYSERAKIADTLQASLLPDELPRIPEIDLAAAFVASGRHNIVGGDFYDVFQSGDGAWAAIVGDVAGKGAKAAAITATARHTLRAAALLDSDPTRNLALLNRVLLLAGQGDSEFCSVVYVRLDPKPGRLDVRLAHAGHPPALILRHDGTVEPVNGGRGPLAGIYPDAEFGDTEATLGAGDTLLLYTDGVTEAQPSNIALGEQQLASTLSRARGRPAGDVAEAIKDSALQIQAGTPRDDIAVLAIRVPTT